MGDDGGRNEDDVAGPHLHDELELVKYDMAAQLGVEVAKDDDGTSSEREVLQVPVLEADGLRAEVHGDGREGAVATDGVPLQAVLLGDLGVRFGVELVKARRPCVKRVYLSEREVSVRDRLEIQEEAHGK